MNLVLALMGGALVGAGIFWRLRDIEALAKSGASKVAARRGRAAQSRRSTTVLASQPAPKAAEAKDTEAEAMDDAAPSSSGQGARRSDRVLLKIPVDVSGTDMEGKSFTERTQTVVINRNGASFVLRAILRPEDRMMVKNLQSGQSAKFRACMVNQELPGGLREWGVECIDPAAPTFWGISFSEPTVEPSTEEEKIGTLLECTVCHFREMTESTLSEYRTIVGKTSLARYCMWCGVETNWSFAAIQDIEEPKPSSPKAEGPAVSPPDGKERRGDKRRIAKLPISIRHEDGREEFTISENVSISGVCCAASIKLEVGDRVFLTLESEEGSGEAETHAHIKWRRHFSAQKSFLYGMMYDRGESAPPESPLAGDLS